MFGLYKSVLVTLIYLRDNRIQEELTETYGTSQSTISRAVSGLTWLRVSCVLAEPLRTDVPIAEEFDPTRQYVVDVLLPCWSWAARPGLSSGKHKTTGLNVQIVCSQEGQLLWVWTRLMEAGTTPTV